MRRQGTFPELGGVLGGPVQPSVIFEDRTGAVWAGTVGAGLFRFDREEGVSRVAVSHPDILSLAEDVEGNLWVGTGGGGLDRIHRRVVSLVSPATGLPFEGVRSVCQDREGRLWAAGLDGELACYEGGAWKTPGEELGPAEFVNCVAADAAGRVWVGTRGGILYVWENGVFRRSGVSGEFGGKSVRTLLPGKSGELWIGTDDGNGLFRMAADGVEMRRFVLPDGFRYVRALAEDAEGSVWAGASDGLLVRISGETVEDLTAMTQRVSIRCLHGAANGDVWIGFSGAGAGRWRAGKYASFGLAEGIPNAYISQILTDGLGMVWFAGNQGIFEIREDDFAEVESGQARRVTPVVYGRNEDLTGLQAVFDYTPTSARAAGNRLFFSMLTGLAEVRLAHAAINPVPPPVFLTAVTAGGRTIRVEPELKLEAGPAGAESGDGHRQGKETGLRFPPGQVSMEFVFTGLSFVAPERSRFRYKLEGLDTDWVDGGTRRSAVYAHPPAGSYRFRVSACNNDGLWNEAGDSVVVTIGSWFWETVWFRTVSVLVLSGVVSGLVVSAQRRRHRRELQQLEHQRALEHERTRIARDLHDDLGVGLTEIGLMGDLAVMNEDSTPENQERLREISGRARQLAVSLDEIVWAINPANDTSSSLVDYFFPYAQKLLASAGLRCRLTVEEPLPPGIHNAEERHEIFHAFKEALNNVIRHAGAASVQISLAVREGELSLCVADDGRGIDAAVLENSRRGLAGMRARLIRLGGTCRIVSRPGEGTAVTFMIPVTPTAAP